MNTYLLSCVRACVRACVRVFVCVCVCARARVCGHVCTRVRVYHDVLGLCFLSKCTVDAIEFPTYTVKVCMDACMCVYAYMYTHI